MLWLAIPFGLAIGLVVGAVGGGGAILALPVLVYVLGEGVGPASTASLIVVALAAAVGAGARARDGHVCWRLALLFSAPAAVGSLLGALLSAQASPRVLILAFVPVMFAAAGATWQRSRERARRRGRSRLPADQDRRRARRRLRGGRADGVLRRRRRLHDRAGAHALPRPGLQARRRHLAGDHHAHRPRGADEPPRHRRDARLRDHRHARGLHDGRRAARHGGRRAAAAAGAGPRLRDHRRAARDLPARSTRRCSAARRSPRRACSRRR